MTIQDTYKSIEKIAFQQITEIGGLIQYFIFSIMFLILGHITLFFNLLISIVAIMIVAVTIKILYFKKRPNKQKRKGNIIERIDAASFPSIHSMRTLSLVFWLIIFFNNQILTVYLTIIGLLVVYSRIYLKKHDWIDVIFGLIFSFIINLSVWWFV